MRLGGVGGWRKFSVEEVGYSTISTEEETVTVARKIINEQTRADVWTAMVTGSLLFQRIQKSDVDLFGLAEKQSDSFYTLARFYSKK